MSPPVSNAVQGGYLVAVFFTGAVFGGLSLVFREICEGLGCLLGGFCLSMWFLALKSGGLLTASAPKAGMIIAFAVGFYSLSFSHYTRSYGLIGCTSFAGATALVLGIDCYSRAGLKEFWLYIWGKSTIFLSKLCIVADESRIEPKRLPSPNGHLPRDTWYTC